MEEDIKILEFWKESEIEFPLQNVRKPLFPEREKQAIENLIKGYRELEEDNKKAYAKYLNARTCIDKFSTQTILKSKIKEKIEKYNKEIDKLYNKKLWNEPVDTIRKNRLVNYINVLKELLEEEKQNDNPFVPSVVLRVDEYKSIVAELEKKDRIINKMAERLTTDIHSKEWVIDYYEREVEK